jgi:serine/threonine-protein kinase
MGDREQALLRVGTTLKGKYRLDALVGVGGMASVYRATHRNRAQLAVKLLHPELSQRAEVRARFVREGYAANSVGHPGVVLVVDDDVADDGSAFLVMELLDGVGVEELSARFPQGVPLEVGVAIVRQLLDVLEAAHTAGIVHRDVKPANLFVTRDGTVKVLDFGIARVLEGAGTSALATGAGVPMGTPAFMSPEQALGRSHEVDARTDVWAAGATLFTLLTGKLVHEPASISGAEMLVHAATRPAPLLGSVAPAIPAAIASVVDRALAFDRQARWPTARAMADALAEANGGPPSKRVLAALVPPRSTSSLHEPVAALSSLASAPTVDAWHPERVASNPTAETTMPVASSKSPRAARARRTRWMALGGAVVALAAAGVTLQRLASHRGRPPVATPAAAVAGEGPPLITIPGFENRTTDPIFDGVLDQMLETALWRSQTLYPLAGPSVRALLSEYAPEATGKPDDVAGVIAERMKRPVIMVRGTVASDGAGYVITLTATDGTSRAVVLDRTVHAASADRVGPAVAGMSCDLRAALHDAPCDELSRVHTGMSDTIEADHEFVLGRGALQSGRFADAAPHLQRAAEIDTDFTKARVSLGLALWNSGRISEGQLQLDRAMARRDMLSERDAAQLDASYHLLRNEFAQAIADYERILARWPADTRFRTNLAAAYYERGEQSRALETGLLAKREHPRLVVTRANVVCYYLATGDLAQTVTEARDVLDAFPHPPPLTYALSAGAAAMLGRRTDAVALQTSLEKVDPDAAVTVLADFALFEGRFADAVATLKAGIASDEARKATDTVQSKWAMLAEALLRQGNVVGARDAAAHAEESPEMIDQLRAARVYAAVGKPDLADALAKKIASRPGERAPLFSRLAAAAALLGRHKASQFASTLGTIGTTSGSWLARADLGAAYFAAGAYEDAERELGLCVQLRGVGALTFYDDTATLRYLPAAYYWLARAKDALHRPDAAAAYAAFLALEPEAQDDPLVRDARQRSGRLGHR